MIVEKRKNVRIIPNKLNEGKVADIGKKLIIEELGAFKEQYEISDFVTNSLQCAIDRWENTSVRVHVGKEVLNDIVVDIVVRPSSGTIVGEPMAEIYRFDEIEKTCSIRLYLPASFKRFDWSTVYLSVNHVIAHELMHYFIFTRRAIKGLTAEDLTEDYPYWIDVLRNDKTSELTYMFVYGLYSTRYQEVNAIVSQSSRSVSAYLKANHNEPTTENISTALSRNSLYASFVGTMRFAKRYMKATEVKRSIADELRALSNGFLDYDDKMMNDMLLGLYSISKHAISKIHKNMAWLIKKTN